MEWSMSSAAGKLPNERFRRERQRRGWSREYIAEQIGIADSKTIGRWERGVAFPRAFYLQKLCALFEMFAVDLGFYQEDIQQAGAQQLLTTNGRQSTDDMLHACSRLPLYDPVIPALPVEITWIYQQDELLNQMKQGLCTGESPISSALYGLTGVGKTTLAIDLVHDHDIQRRFHDGILWAELGPRPDIPELLRRWGILLGFTPVEIASLNSVADLASILRANIGMRRLLLVIDDARRSEDALSLKLGGPHCAYVLTTRVASVALDFANDRAMLMRELNNNTALSSLSPAMDAGETSAERPLVSSGDGFSTFFRLS